MGKAPSDRRRAAAAEAAGSGSAPGTPGAPPSNTAPQNCIWTDDLAILRSGVDTLQLGYRGELLGEAEARLVELKKLAQAENKGEQGFAQWELDGELFSVLPRGSGRMPFTLISPHFRLSLSSGRGSMPVAHAQVQSELLTKSGPEAAIKKLQAILSGVCSISEGPHVSRIDICVDFSTRFDMESISRHDWVTRAKRIWQHVEMGNFTGWSIGLKSATAARLYDKTAEILVSDKGYMREIWRDMGWDGTTPVWRLEFEVKREAIRQFGLDDMDTRPLCAALWSHLTHEWLRLAVPSPTDSTRSRWDTHPMWRRLSVVDFGAHDVPSLQRVRTTQPPGRDWLFRSAGSGILAFMALEGIEDFREGCRRYGEAYLGYLDEFAVARGSLSETFIEERLRSLRRRYHLGVNERRPGEHDPVASALARYFRKGKDGD